jgi:YD repeat-containing protein
MSKNFAWLALLWIVISGAGVLAQPGPNVRYIYDEAGYLLGVVDDNGNATAYKYDVFGNLVSVDRMSARGPVDIFFVNPNHGLAAIAPQPGTAVTIHGIGFSAQPAGNQVTFNGVPSRVDAATETTIRTTVPAGATTGPVEVTAPKGAAHSRKNFLVLSAAVSPPHADLRVGQQQQFAAVLLAGDYVGDTDASWSVNGIAGGNSVLGKIDPTGLYTAPARSPLAMTVTVTATNREGPPVSASATVSVAPSGIGPFYAHGASYRIARPAPAQTALAPIFTSGASYTSVTITALSPSHAPRGTADLSLTVTGMNFNGAMALDFLLPGGARDSNITVTNVAVNSQGTQLTATLSVAGAAALGARTLVVRTPPGASTSRATAGNQFVIE